jgi:hypothetical protein
MVFGSPPSLAFLALGWRKEVPSLLPMLIHEAFLAELIVSSRRRNERYQKHVSRLAAADIAVMCKNKAAPPLFLTFSICSV